ncbi:hypothetical protein DVU_1151 [Nitratidesulfovibrio vulgaris str. Hildenborough]|uniref:Uncharacterized protein n=1 Tax=Nitratidesulfovibrio vulgaris (strain ATCC 29579 / DSM 644 / CCUG 34227 / NCIMB 8303 / VKM B-1760 / Hildenborough) TaxID=882 RepID=Q72CY2_NITV2|nr:hypothetical protein DVU_1151 [Nitratidesulfovibrio vulgaris str. Hildenborough]
MLVCYFWRYATCKSMTYYGGSYETCRSFCIVLHDRVAYVVTGKGLDDLSD